MTERDFAYWLKGFFEISDAKVLDEQQVKIVKDHLELVFHKVTPTYKPKELDSFVHSASYAGKNGITLCGAPLNEETRYSRTAIDCPDCIKSDIFYLMSLDFTQTLTDDEAKLIC